MAKRTSLLVLSPPNGIPPLSREAFVRGDVEGGDEENARFSSGQRVARHLHRAPHKTRWQLVEWEFEF